MAISASNIANLLFKKFITGLSITSPDKNYFEEAIQSRSNILLEDVYTDEIPFDNPLLNTSPPQTVNDLNNGDESGVVKFIENRTLTNIPGTAAFQDETGDPVSFRDLIPFSYGSGYDYVIKTPGGRQLALGENNYFLDNNSGVLIFFDGEPPVDATSTITVSAFKYIGTKGEVLTSNNIELDSNNTDLDSNPDKLVTKELLKNVLNLQPGEEVSSNILKYKEYNFTASSSSEVIDYDLLDINELVEIEVYIEAGSVGSDIFSKQLDNYTDDKNTKSLTLSSLNIGSRYRIAILGKGPSVSASNFSLEFNLGDWQNSVLGVITDRIGSPSVSNPFTESTGFDSPSLISYFSNLNATDNELTRLIENGDRFLYNGDDIIGSPGIKIINRVDSSFSYGNLLKGSIIEWVEASERGITDSGWLVAPPQEGMFTSIDGNPSDELLRYNSSNWGLFVSGSGSGSSNKEEISLGRLLDSHYSDNWQILSNTNLSTQPVEDNLDVYINSLRESKFGVNPGIGLSKIEIDPSVNSGLEFTNISDINIGSPAQRGFSIPNNEGINSNLTEGLIVKVRLSDTSEFYMNIIQKTVGSPNTDYILLNSEVEPLIGSNTIVGITVMKLESGYPVTNYPLSENINSIFTVINPFNLGYETEYDKDFGYITYFVEPS